MMTPTNLSPMEPESGRIPDLPGVLYLEPTTRCNLRCRGCILYRGGWEPERDLSLSELVAVTDQLPGLERVFLHGIGEPLLNRELPAMIRHLKQRGVYVLFNSNGLLLDARRQNELVESGLDELRISLDAASPRVYRKIRGSGEFGRVVDNVESLLRLQRQRRVTRPKLSLWFLGTRDNIAELPDFVRLAAGIGVAEAYLQRLVYFQDGEGYGVARHSRTLQNGAGTASALIRKSQRLAAALGIQFNASGLSTPADSVRVGSEAGRPWRKCYRPSSLMYVTAGGNVLPCCISPFSSADYASIVLGNVFESPVKKIWTGPGYTSFRKRHQSKTPPGCCRGCGVHWSL